MCIGLSGIKAKFRDRFRLFRGAKKTHAISTDTAGSFLCPENGQQPSPFLVEEQLQTACSGIASDISVENRELKKGTNLPKQLPVCDSGRSSPQSAHLRPQDEKAGRNPVNNLIDRNLIGGVSDGNNNKHVHLDLNENASVASEGSGTITSKTPREDDNKRGKSPYPQKQFLKLNPRNATIARVAIPKKSLVKGQSRVDRKNNEVTRGKFKKMTTEESIKRILEPSIGASLNRGPGLILSTGRKGPALGTLEPKRRSKGIIQRFSNNFRKSKRGKKRGGEPPEITRMAPHHPPRGKSLRNSTPDKTKKLVTSENMSDEKEDKDKGGHFNMTPDATQDLLKEVKKTFASLRVDEGNAPNKLLMKNKEDSFKKDPGGLFHAPKELYKKLKLSTQVNAQELRQVLLAYLARRSGVGHASMGSDENQNMSDSSRTKREIVHFLNLTTSGKEGVSSSEEVDSDFSKISPSNHGTSSFNPSSKADRTVTPLESGIFHVSKGSAGFSPRKIAQSHTRTPTPSLESCMVRTSTSLSSGDTSISRVRIRKGLADKKILSKKQNVDEPRKSVRVESGGISEGPDWSREATPGARGSSHTTSTRKIVRLSPTPPSSPVRARIFPAGVRKPTSRSPSPAYSISDKSTRAWISFLNSSGRNSRLTSPVSPLRSSRQISPTSSPLNSSGFQYMSPVKKTLAAPAATLHKTIVWPAPLSPKAKAANNNNNNNKPLRSPSPSPVKRMKFGGIPPKSGGRVRKIPKKSNPPPSLGKKDTSGGTSSSGDEEDGSEGNQSEEKNQDQTSPTLNTPGFPPVINEGEITISSYVQKVEQLNRKLHPIQSKPFSSSPSSELSSAHRIPTLFVKKRNRGQKPGNITPTNDNWITSNNPPGGIVTQRRPIITKAQPPQSPISLVPFPQGKTENNKRPVEKNRALSPLFKDKHLQSHSVEILYQNVNKMEIELADRRDSGSIASRPSMNASRPSDQDKLYSRFYKSNMFNPRAERVVPNRFDKPCTMPPATKAIQVCTLLESKMEGSLFTREYTNVKRNKDVRHKVVAPFFHETNRPNVLDRKFSKKKLTKKFMDVFRCLPDSPSDSSLGILKPTGSDLEFWGDKDAWNEENEDPEDVGEGRKKRNSERPHPQQISQGPPPLEGYEPRLKHDLTHYFSWRKKLRPGEKPYTPSLKKQRLRSTAGTLRWGPHRPGVKVIHTRGLPSNMSFISHTNSQLSEDWPPPSLNSPQNLSRNLKYKVFTKRKSSKKGKSKNGPLPYEIQSPGSPSISLGDSSPRTRYLYRDEEDDEGEESMEVFKAGVNHLLERGSGGGKKTREKGSRKSHHGKRKKPRAGPLIKTTHLPYPPPEKKQYMNLFPFPTRL